MFSSNASSPAVSSGVNVIENQMQHDGEATDTELKVKALEPALVTLPSVHVQDVTQEESQVEEMYLQQEEGKQAQMLPQEVQHQGMHASAQPQDQIAQSQEKLELIPREQPQADQPQEKLKLIPQQQPQEEHVLPAPQVQLGTLEAAQQPVPLQAHHSQQLLMAQTQPLLEVQVQSREEAQVLQEQAMPTQQEVPLSQSEVQAIPHQQVQVAQVYLEPQAQVAASMAQLQSEGKIIPELAPAQGQQVAAQTPVSHVQPEAQPQGQVQAATRIPPQLLVAKEQSNGITVGQAVMFAEQDQKNAQQSSQSQGSATGDQGGGLVLEGQTSVPSMLRQGPREKPYTQYQIQKMVMMLNNLREKYQGEEQLQKILSFYIQDVLAIKPDDIVTA